jgi:hypothetical protein
LSWLVLAFSIIPLADLIVLPIAFFVAVCGCLAAVISLILLLGSALRGGAAPRSLLGSFAAALIGGALSLVAADEILNGPQRATEAGLRRAAEVARPLPAAAPPDEVVRFVVGEGAGKEGSDGRRRIVCGLAAPAVRGECLWAADTDLGSNPVARTVRTSGEMALVQFGVGGSLAPDAFVRLRRGPRGWELLDRPRLIAAPCVRDAVRRAEDPFACEPDTFGS